MAQTWAYVNDGEGATIGTSLDLSAFAATAGYTIFLAVGTMNTASTASVSPNSLSDTAGNTYNLLDTHDYILLGAYGMRVHLYAAYNITGNANNVVSLGLAASGYLRGIAGQVSGLLISPLDADYAPDSINVADTPATSNADTTAENDEVVVGAFFFANAGARTFSSSDPSVLQEAVSEDSISLALATNHIAAAGSASIAVARDGAAVQCLIVNRAFKQAATSSIKTIKGLAKASVKTIDGLAIASVKSWEGLQ